MAVRVSVVIPTVERPDLLEQAVDSVLAQEGVEVEVLVVFDGVEARSVSDDPRVHTLSSGPTRVGVGAARNVGLAVADGSHVAFLDDDDLWAPDRLGPAVAAADAAPVVVTWSRHYGGPRGSGRLLSGEVEHVILDTLTPSVGAVLVDRVRMLDFDEQWLAVEDIDWWIRMAQQSPVITVPHDGHLIRRHEGMRWGNGQAARARENLALIEWHRAWFDQHPSAEAFRLRRAASYAVGAGNHRQARQLLSRSMRLRPGAATAKQWATTWRRSR